MRYGVNMKTILIIEDDVQINDMLKVLLSKNGFETISAYSGTEGLLAFNDNVDLVLLDLMLPGKSGDEIIGEIKGKKNVPVIVSSAITDVQKKVDLFSLGADDYVTKPFDNDELLARIVARIKMYDKLTSDGSQDGSIDDIITYKDITLDRGRRIASCNDTEMNLSKIEYDILALLVENKSRTCTKGMIYDIVWEYEGNDDDNALNVHMSNIRRKLKKCNADNDYIETVWGVGYRLKK